MKIALIGDIHGNYRALETVLAAASVHRVEKLLVTGDLVGYYFAPLQVVDLLAEWDKYVVRGNHEVMLAAARSDPAYLEIVDARYGKGVRFAIEQMSSVQLDALCSLPHPLELDIDELKILLCHGSPWDLHQYVYPDSDQELILRCAAGHYDFIVMGHTHYPMFKKVGKTILVNPGSVGQPRNRQQRACWVCLNTEDKSVTFNAEIYNVGSLISECKSYNPEVPYLHKVLMRT